MSTISIDINKSTNEAIDYLINAKYPIVLSGAGISADSGIPTFRKNDSKSTKASYFGNYKNFINDPRLWWEDQLNSRDNIKRTKFRQSVEKAVPNNAHIALAKLEKLGYLKHIITQNVDELHTKAGSNNITEIHGSRYKCRCIKCEKKFPRDSVSTTILPPLCECGGIIKFDTVLFGEPIPKSVLSKCNNVINKSDFIMVVGTSNLVNPSASFPKFIKKKGGIVIEANTNPTPISSISNVILRGSTSILLPILVENLLKRLKFGKD